jgi:hypothetical protein
MKNKRIYELVTKGIKYLFILSCFSTNAQNITKGFLDKYKLLSESYLFDEFEYKRIISDPNFPLKKIDLNEFKQNTILYDDKRQAIDVYDRSGFVFYPIGKYVLKDYICLITLLKTDLFSEVYLHFYDTENRLINNNTIQLLVDSKNKDPLSSLFFANSSIYVSTNNGKKHQLLNGFPQFGTYDFEYNESAPIYLKDVKERNFITEISFDFSFFKNSHNCIDMLFFNEFKNQYIYFKQFNEKVAKNNILLTSYLLADYSKILFFKTDYKFVDDENYSIINYCIITKDGNIIKNVGIATYSDINEEDYLPLAKIYLKNNILYLEYSNLLENTSTKEKFYLK